ncbi:MAG: cytochrome c biogenesis protein CcsA [Planctomycetes bacterium]|nr:cytochrome c biogenesis protein CcsA [Planctomycetota bacterium]
MATGVQNAQTTDPEYRFPEQSDNSGGQAVLRVLKVLASLKITVVLFFMAVLIVLIGTLAQTRDDIWVVVREYFRSWFVMVPLKVFFPPAWFPNTEWPDISIPFLGGWSIGALMGINLVAAHLVRFRVQASGGKVAAGVVVIAAGCLLTAAVIMGGNGSTFQGTPLLDPSTRILWQLVQATIAGVVLLAGCVLVFKKRAGIVLLHGGVGLMMFSELWVGKTAVEAQMHIVEGETVNFVQDIRTTELAVIDPSEADSDKVVAIPQRFLQADEVIRHDALPFDLKIVKYLQNSDLRSLNSEDKNLATAGLGLQMIAVPAKASVGTSNDGKVDESAVYVQVLKKGTGESLGTYLSTLIQTRLSESRLKTGLSESEIQSRFRVGPFVLKMSQPTEVECDGKTYRIALRFKRTYEPYSLRLEDVRFDRYVGTNTPKNYSSRVRLVDPTRNVDQEVTIWMNNPLRFAGQTFYQSSVGADPITGIESTGLQVVTNSGWMIPYVSCMIIVVGMLDQFGVALLRFLRRKERQGVVQEFSPAGQTRGTSTTGATLAGAKKKLGAATQEERSRELVASGFLGVSGSRREWIPVAIVVTMFVFSLAWYSWPKSRKSGEFDYASAGRIPVVYEGRVKPLDTLARNALQVISGGQTLSVPKAGYPIAENDEDPVMKSQPAIVWLLDLISGNEKTAQHRIFKINNPYVVELLDLKRRKSHLYTLDEIRGKNGKNLEKFYDGIKKARAKPVEKVTSDDRKLLDLDKQIRAFTGIAAGFLDREFNRPKVFDSPDDELREMARGRRTALLRMLSEEEEQRAEGHPPLPVPVRLEGDGNRKYEWKAYYSAYLRDAIESKVLGEKKPDPNVAAWGEILTAYEDGLADDFNRSVDKYVAQIAADPPDDVKLTALAVESFYNRVSPLNITMPFYILAFVLSALGWLFWTGPMNRAAFWLIVMTFALHTLALLARIYISGRPPVTNLYSTAPFIGWACVVGGIAVERLYRIGIGNIVATIAGFSTSFIAYKLSVDGDTFTVMQAVLDTQFWLATHVVCINLGYAPTFLAGLLGIALILRGTCTWTLTPHEEKEFGRMIYGTLCFALFFSFFGTVLGGLWADDSWGRFWGWDPKENGALMIVLWNAMILHARWDGLVKDRGMALLAIGGNIVTAWSWFGVNELGVGLHSYGFKEGTLHWLGLFVLSQLAIIGLGSLPRQTWLSATPAKTT